MTKPQAVFSAIALALIPFGVSFIAYPVIPQAPTIGGLLSLALGGLAVALRRYL